MKKQVIFFVINFLSLVILLSNAQNVAENGKKRREVIIDTDAGADDAVAILLALKYEAANEDIRIIAITCTYGNTEEKNVETNVLKVLTIANRSDIPVYGGVESPLIKYWEDNHYFGTDGLGDFNFNENIIASIDRSKSAPVALIDLVNANPGEVSIIALGPLTNIALAIKLNKNFVNLVKEFHIVGSSISGVGNIGPNVEFNFGTDPESSFIVLNSTTKPSILMPWEVETDFPITAKWREFDFGKLNSKAVIFLNQAEAVVLKNSDFWRSVDGRMIATFCWPNLITDSFLTNVTPVFDGAAQGSVLVDYLNNTGKAHNARIIKSFNVKLYKNLLLQYFAD